MMSILKNNYLIGIFLLGISIYNAQGQNDLENHKKYWYYKTRLNNDFIKIGNTPPNGSNDTTSHDHGESMPFNERAIESAPYTFTGNELKLGDGGTRLGIYISTLATEYRLLKNGGQDVTTVKHELFCALNAVNRIDYYAESIFSNGNMSPNLNGFFIRDDMPPNFVKNNYRHFNYYSENGVNGIGSSDRENDRGFTQTFKSGMNKNSSDYFSYLLSVLDGDSRNEQLKSTEESQDQVYYLLMGLALTSQLVDDNEVDGLNVFGYGSGETELKKEARNISDRIIKHIKNSAGGLWKIRNPANGNAFVQIGADASVYAYPLDNAGCFIKYGQDLPFIFYAAPFYPTPFNTCTDYRNFHSSITGPPLWNTLAINDGGPTVDMQGFYHALSGICNCIYEDMLFKNLNVQQSISDVQNQINQLQTQLNNSIANFLHNLPPWVSQSANWVQNFINQLTLAVNTVLNVLQSTISQMLLNLFPSFKTNTTDVRLVHNTYHNSVNYTPIGGSNPTAFHLGSDAYFGVLLRDVLHPNVNIIQLPNWLQFAVPMPAPGHLRIKNDMIDILNGAPCEGNFNEYPNIPSSPYWGASNRIDRIDAVWKANSSEGLKAEFAGTDYMLLHNLYYLREGTTSSFVNYSDRKVLQSMPYSGIFSTSNKKMLGAYEYISAFNTINSNGAADYRAGKEIALLPGFSSIEGSDFSAFISPFNCSASGSNINRMLNNNSDDGFNDGIVKSKQQQSYLTKDEHYQNNDSSNYSNFKSQLDSLVKNINDQKVFATKVEVYPNPNNGDFNIEFNLDTEDNVEVIIYDIVGKEIFKHKNVTGYLNIPINLKDYAKGIYIVRFKNTNGVEFYKKITIQ